MFRPHRHFGRTRLVGAGLAALWLTGAATPAAEPDRPRTWNSTDGKSLVGTLTQFGASEVGIKLAGAGHVVRVPISRLSQPDADWVTQRLTDMPWRLAHCRWPSKIEPPLLAELNSRTRQEAADSVFSTPHFEMRGAEADPGLRTELAGLFESCHKLFSELPWSWLTSAATTSGKFPVRLYPSQREFEQSPDLRSSHPPTGPPIGGTAAVGRVLGLYSQRDRTVHIPLDSFGGADLLDRQANSKTRIANLEVATRVLRHEIAHQLTHDVCVLAPWWISEGLAEYAGNLPVREGAFLIDTTSIARNLATLAARDRVDPASINQALKKSNAVALDAALQWEEASMQRATRDLNRALLSAYELAPPKDTTPPPDWTKPPVPEARPLPGPAANIPWNINAQYRSAHLLFFYLMYLQDEERTDAFLRYFWRGQALALDFRRYQNEREAFVTELKSIESQLAKYKGELKSEVLANKDRWIEHTDGRFGYQGTKSYAYVAERLKLPANSPAVPQSVRAMAASEEAARKELEAVIAGRTGTQLWSDAVAAFDKLGIVLRSAPPSPVPTTQPGRRPRS